ncbi:hypothetical protein AB0I55_22350 [Actinocatenispora sera]|uniref:hypothetical protein n=1 Tax=Actinocatenispora sera TaxID=390989 RepID=UPI003400D1CA
MTHRFADILQGLMDNRGLLPRAVSRASARAESTILQLLHGSLPPSPELVRDIAPVLQIPEADLLAIAGLEPIRDPEHLTPYRHFSEVGELVSVASSLSNEQLRRLIIFARNLRSEDEN